MINLFRQGDFQIDANSTPEILRKKRERLAAMMPQYGKARYVGEGIGQLFTGISSGRQNRAMDKFEGERSSEATAQGQRAMGGGGNPMSILGMMPQAGPEQGLADDAMAAMGKPAMGGGSNAAAIRAGLIQRGLPEHVADGFMMNFQDESGMDPGINERNPTVPGSRGGFGLYQLTGPRRREYEAFAQARGVPVDSVEAQLDFMMTELQGKESGAANAIFGTQNAGDAGAAIVNKFLRPNETSRASREARYTGGQGMATTQVAGGFNLAELRAAAARPFQSAEMRAQLNAMIQQVEGQQQTAQTRQFKREDLDRERELDRQDPRNQQLLELGQIQIDQARAPQPSFTPVTPQEVEALGLPPGAYQRGPDNKVYQVGGGGQTINVGGASEFGTIPPGFELFTDPATKQRSMRPIAGGPADVEAQAAATRSQNNATQTASTASLVSQDIKLAMALTSNWTAGTGSLLANMPGTDAKNLESRLNTIKANVGFDRLQQMRESSPTGGALGGIAVPELVMLQAVLGSLDQAQSPTQLADNLRRLEEIYAPIAAKAAAYPNAADFGFSGGADSGNGMDFSGMNSSDLMTVDIMTLTPDQFDAYEQALRGMSQ